METKVLSQIVDEIEKKLNEDNDYPPIGIALVLKAKHLCKSMRGCKKEGWMTTNVFKGVFREDDKVRNEFLQIIGGK